MSWEDDDFVPDVPTLAPAADEEDVDKALLKEGAASLSTEPAGPAAPAVIKPKHLEKAKLKEREERSARERAEMAAAAAAGADAVLSDPVAEKRRVEALQQKADLAFAAEAIGGGRKVSLEALVAQLTVTDGEAFKSLGRLVSERVHELAGPKGAALAMRFYAEVVAAAGDRVGVDELKALENAVAVARNKKLTAEKDKKGGKKKVGAKVHVGGDLDGARGGARARRARRAADATLTPSHASSADYDGYDNYPRGGNSGNVAASMAAAGMETTAAPAAAPAAGAEFTKPKFKAEEDFM